MTLVTASLAAVATCALGRRVMPDDLPPGALRRPRIEVLALLDVADPDDARLAVRLGAHPNTPPPIPRTSEWTVRDRMSDSVIT
ncbi:hypothetical protein [Streptomyces sp. NPDC092952]|uniref:hypothetical protein n=1 Tax=Streptomyces sp. NPDC092952 TaxID=3366018 RepID=UPI0038089A43